MSLRVAVPIGVFLVLAAAITAYPPFSWGDERLQTLEERNAGVDGAYDGKPTFAEILPVRQRASLFGPHKREFTLGQAWDGQRWFDIRLTIERHLLLQELALEYLLAAIISGAFALPIQLLAARRRLRPHAAASHALATAPVREATPRHPPQRGAALTAPFGSTFRKAGLFWAIVTLFTMPRNGLLPLLANPPEIDAIFLLGWLTDMSIATLMNGVVFGGATAAVLQLLRRLLRRRVPRA